MSFQCLASTGDMSRSISWIASLVCEEARLWKTASTLLSKRPLFSSARIVFSNVGASALSEIAAISDNADAPTFENTILALENSGRLLSKVEAVFHNLASSHTNDAIQEIERDMSPVLAKHWNDIYLNARLFKRIDALQNQPLQRDDGSRRVLERYHLDFVRSGAKLEGAARQRYAAIIEELAT